MVTKMGGSYCEYPGRAVIALSGKDRVSFLQALISNDISTLSPGGARWAALLTPQGKYLCDFFVVDAGERLLLDIEAGRAEELGHVPVPYPSSHPLYQITSPVPDHVRCTRSRPLY